MASFVRIVSLFTFIGKASCGPNVTVSPGNYDEDDISVSYDDDEWRLAITNGFPVDKWELEVTMAGSYQFNTGSSAVTVELNGDCVYNECDLFWGFGTDTKYFTFLHDFDGILSGYLHCGSSLAVDCISHLYLRLLIRCTMGSRRGFR